MYIPLVHRVSVNNVDYDTGLNVGNYIFIYQAIILNLIEFEPFKKCLILIL